MTSFAGLVGGVGIALVAWAAAACTSFDPHLTATTTSVALATGSGSIGPGGAGGAGGMGAAGGAVGMGGAGGSVAAPPDYCSTCKLTEADAVVENAIAEASGIAASRVHQGVYYVNNDSGDSPRFFAVGAGGEKRGIFTMPVTHVDYEDIAVGPCPGGSCVFVADIGDNDEERSSCSLYRVREPAELGGGSVAVDTLPFVYADGPHNAETLLVHPITGEIAVVTKNKAGPSIIFRAPAEWAPGHTATLQKAGNIEPPTGDLRFTGGSVHPAGRGVLLRTYTHLFYYAASAPGAPLAETLSHEPCSLPVADEDQGEAVSWTAAGDGYVTVGEGVSPTLQHASCHAE